MPPFFVFIKVYSYAFKLYKPDKTMTTLPILYSFRRCPYAMRARMAIAYTQQKVELREVVLKNKPPSLLNYSAKATVPVLILEDKTVIDESIDIMLWALSLDDKDQWLENCQEQKALIALNDHSFKTKLDRFMFVDRFNSVKLFSLRYSLSNKILVETSIELKLLLLKRISSNKVFSETFISEILLLLALKWVNKILFETSKLDRLLLNMLNLSKLTKSSIPVASEMLL